MILFRPPAPLAEQSAVQPLPQVISRAVGITPIPVKYDTGIFAVTKENVELLFNKAKI